MLIESQIMAAKPAEKRFRLRDALGLYLEVMPSGVKTFRVDYRLDGKSKKETIGNYPTVRLAEARRRVAQIKEALIAGEQPVKARPASYKKPDAEEAAASAAAEAQTWRFVAEEFIAKRIKEGMALTTENKMLRNLRRTYGDLGDTDISEIKGVDLLPVLRRFEEAGKFETVKDIRCRMSQVFRYAVAVGKATHDPAHLIRDALIRSKPSKRPGITDPKEVGALMRSLRAYAGLPPTRAAMLLTAYTALRSTELRGAEWSEIDFDAKVWTVPQSRMKQHYGQHRVPLSTQAVEVLEEIKGRTGRGRLVFPASASQTRWMSENTVNAALRRIGYDTKTQHCNHGFRTTFSTNLNEMGFNRDWIEKQLSHCDRDEIRSAYNAARYIEGRTEMMQVWADWLDRQEGGASI